MSLEFDYFYGAEAEQFTFFRIPKVLFKDATFNPKEDAKHLQKCFVKVADVVFIKQRDSIRRI